jgi:hypothetical protein
MILSLSELLTNEFSLVLEIFVVKVSKTAKTRNNQNLKYLLVIFGSRMFSGPIGK